MTVKRYLIVNADDFGQSTGINRGIIEAHGRGIVTSASLMVRWPGAVEAAQYGRSHPELSLGLHLDFGEWAYRAGDWIALYEVVPVDDERAAATEVNHQLEIFHRLAGQDPTHIDSHQHVHQREPLRSIVIEVARQLGVPLRHEDDEVRYCGNFYGQTAEGTPLPSAISVAALNRILAALPPGITELGCHPGEGHDLETMYRDERAEEVRILCDPRMRAVIMAEKIELRSFRSSGNRVRGTNKNNEISSAEARTQ